MSNWWNFDLTYGIPINFGAGQNTNKDLWFSPKKKKKKLWFIAILYTGFIS